jgi:hypothetical protein
MEPIFNDDGLMLKLNVIHKLRKVLQREGKGYQSALHRRVGVGLSDAEFAVCVKLLEVSGWCTLTKGERGAVLLTLNEAYRNTSIFTAEEVIADAMGQQKP